MRLKLTLMFILLFTGIGFTISHQAQSPYPEMHPHSEPVKRNRFMELLGRGRVCSSTSIERERSNLNSLLVSVAMYYSDGLSSYYPENPQVFDLSLQCLESEQNDATKELPQDWQIPDNWQDFNQSQAAFAFLRSPQEKYTGSRFTPMFIIKPGFNSHPHCRQLVFEDGHTECIAKIDAISLWEKIGVNNEKK